MSRSLAKIVFSGIFIAIFLQIKAQNTSTKIYKTATIMFYNVENLYDTIKSADIINGNLSPNDSRYQISVSEDSSLSSKLKVYRGELTFERLKGKRVIRKHILTDEFYSKGTKLWNSKRYYEKINNLSKVIINTGKKETQNIPTIVGLCEIENEHVLEDLCKSLNSMGGLYGFVHLNSFDARGIDVALLYDKSRFLVLNKQKLFLNLRNEKGYRNYSRDILLVEGLLDEEKIYFFVNHWPSRRGGEQKSMPRRIVAAETLKKAMDSIRMINPSAKILAMGDFNDDPTNYSIKKILNTVSKKDKVNETNYFNPSERLFKKGIGTLAYQDSFSLFDQQIMSPALVNGDDEGFHFYKMDIYSPSFLITQEGPWKGYPFRSFSGNNYTKGYSDHYPVYSILIKEMK